MAGKKILLLVCTGNTCRSPLAKVLIEAALSGVGVDDWEVDSAGLAVFSGMPASAEARILALEAGLDLSQHRAKPLLAELLEKAELVLVMTAGHKAALLAGFAGYGGKIYTIKNYAGLTGDVADPFGGGFAFYRETAQELSGLASLLAEKLK